MRIYSGIILTFLKILSCLRFQYPHNRIMSKENALVDRSYLLQRFPGKGGWTYALIPEIPMGKRFPFGLMKVRGKIDAYILEQCKLMPFGNGQLFLPVKAAIRKQIKKKEGDWVKIILFEDHSSKTVPTFILDCLKDAPLALQRFFKLPEWEQKLYIDSIVDAKKEETKVDRLVRMIEKLTF